jgi:hypothetical protein
MNGIYTELCRAELVQIIEEQKETIRNCERLREELKGVKAVLEMKEVCLQGYRASEEQLKETIRKRNLLIKDLRKQLAERTTDFLTMEKSRDSWRDMTATYKETYIDKK